MTDEIYFRHEGKHHSQRNLTFRILTSILFCFFAAKEHGKNNTKEETPMKRTVEDCQWGNKDFACFRESITGVLLFPFSGYFSVGKLHSTTQKKKEQIYCKYFDARM